MVPEARTVDGFEQQIGTNHLGHFALTNLLLPHITGRVVTVSYHLHAGGALNLDDLNWQSRPYRSSQAYADSKLANVLFTLELQRRLTAAGSSVRALAVRGHDTTNLFGHATGLSAALIRFLGRIVMQDAEHGARSTLFAATTDIPGGSFVWPGGLAHMRGHPEIATPSRGAEDPRWPAVSGICRLASRPSTRLAGSPSRRDPLRRSPAVRGACCVGRDAYDVVVAGLDREGPGAAGIRGHLCADRVVAPKLHGRTCLVAYARECDFRGRRRGLTSARSLAMTRGNGRWPRVLLASRRRWGTGLEAALPPTASVRRWLRYRLWQPRRYLHTVPGASSGTVGQAKSSNRAT
jgi:NAD(P)-dependent dehydrogenase (short-subunit alcohol dehydrogenase family)